MFKKINIVMLLMLKKITLWIYIYEIHGEHIFTNLNLHEFNFFQPANKGQDDR